MTSQPFVVDPGYDIGGRMTTDNSGYVAHPRYGRGLRYTGLDPDLGDPDVELHWRTGLFNAAIRAAWDRLGLPSGWVPTPPCFVPGTAIVANPERHVGGFYLPITHYYDLERTCRRCRRPFLFFAEEQNYWYEELGFTLEADCVECHPCRHARQRLDRLKRRYDELLARPGRSPADNVELANYCLRLIELKVFTVRRVERIRYLLNRLPPEWRDHVEVLDLRARLGTLAANPSAD